MPHRQPARAAVPDFALRYSRQVNGEFSPPITIAENEFLAGNYNTAVDNAGVFSAVYATLGTTSSTVFHVRVEDGVVTHQTDVSRTGPALFSQSPSVMVDGNGTVWVAWSGDPRGAADPGVSNEIFVSRSNEGIDFTLPLNVSESVASSSFFTPALAVADAGMLVTWIERTPARVVFRRVDCARRINGRISDGHGHGLEGLLVELTSDGALAPDVRTATDAQGRYVCGCIDEGRYTVRAWLRDFKASGHVFDVRYGDDAPDPVWLEASGLDVDPAHQTVARNLVFSDTPSADFTDSNVPFWSSVSWTTWPTSFTARASSWTGRRRQLGVFSFSTPTRPTPVESYTFSHGPDCLDGTARSTNRRHLREAGIFASLYTQRDVALDVVPREWGVA